MKIEKIAAVLVLYQPDWGLLREALTSINVQCSATFVIDNTPGDHKAAFNRHLADLQQVEYFSMGENLGIAAAQNYGIARAEAAGFDAVIFFDQDSVPESNLLQLLKTQYELLEQGGFKVGSVGPRAVSRATEQQYEAKFARGNRHSSAITEIGQLISSGSLVKLDTFKAVGTFETALFIDIVDFEWCWRALHRYGYKHFIVEDARLMHMFGLKEQRVLGFRITVPSSFRIYYQFRNYLILLQRGYVPRYWKLSNGFKLTIKFFLFPLICADRSNYLKRSLKGILHGFRYSR